MPQKRVEKSHALSRGKECMDSSGHTNGTALSKPEKNLKDLEKEPTTPDLEGHSCP